MAKNPLSVLTAGLGKVNPLALLHEFVAFSKFREEQQTERFRIAENARVALTAIQEQSALMREYLARIFAEREKTLDRLFDHLQAAAANRDGESQAQALAAIVAIVRECPLKPFEQFLQDRKSQKVLEI